MSRFDSMDFQPNSVGVMVVRVIRLKDIVKALGCTEDFAQGVVREIRGETSADGSLAFVLPSQLATWAYQRAGKPVDPPPFETILVKDAQSGDPLKQAAIRAAARQPSTPTSGSTSLKEIRSDLRRLQSATIQAGAMLVTVEQAAARLGCAKTRIFDLLKSGDLTRGSKVGRRTMISLASVDALQRPPWQAPRVAKRAVVTPTRAVETRDEILRKLKRS